MIRTMRSSVAHMAVGLALVSLMTTGAAPAVAAQDEDFETVAETVEALQDPAEPVFAAPIEPAYELIGQGEASYYGRELEGNRTASGERFDADALTAAHRTLPMGTRLRVTNKANGLSVVVRINDRGPFVGRRIIDVSLRAAREIGLVRAGRGQVTLEKLVTA
jgi:rare lipoprotein A